MKHWMFNCKEVSQKLSESMDRSLPLSQRLMIRVHISICKYCTRLQKQLMLLRHAMRTEAFLPADSDSGAFLSQDARKRLKQLVENVVREST